jgi:hypothetical protein
MARISIADALLAVEQNNKNNKANGSTWTFPDFSNYLPEIDYDVDYLYPIKDFIDDTSRKYNKAVNYLTTPEHRQLIISQEQLKVLQQQRQIQKQRQAEQQQQTEEKQIRKYSSSAHPSITYSFSGADCRVYGYFDSDEKIPENTDPSHLWVYSTVPVLLNNFATISLSIHESKSPVRRLGHMAPIGYTKAVRTIAGSMVLTIIGNNHPLQTLSYKDPHSITHFSMDPDNSSNIVTKMSPFNLILLYKSELPGASGSKMKIKGVEFINEGIVTSVNDLVSEVVLQFVALDVEKFESDSYL